MLKSVLNTQELTNITLKNEKRTLLFIYGVAHRSDTALDEPMAAAKTINADVMISIDVSEPNGKGYIKFYLPVS